MHSLPAPAQPPSWPGPASQLLPSCPAPVTKFFPQYHEKYQIFQLLEGRNQ